MITVFKAKKEKRARDKKRNRLLLKIGKKNCHITIEEAQSIMKQLKKTIPPSCFWKEARVEPILALAVTLAFDRRKKLFIFERKFLEKLLTIYM